MVDFRHGIFRREQCKRVATGQRLRFINMTVANEHHLSGITACVKSPMGLVDMSAGQRGIHPLARGYRSVHYFGAPTAHWRMAGPLAHFARKVRSADLHLAVAEWMGIAPRTGWREGADMRIEDASAVRTNTVVAGTDPVAIDAWIARNLATPVGGVNRHIYDLDAPDSTLVKFLRYYRQVYGSGTLDTGLINVS